MKADLVPKIEVSDLPTPSCQKSESFLTAGPFFHYFHYGVAGSQDDRGWGCGYRTLQTICSYINCKKNGSTDAPDLWSIQNTLVELKDKPDRFAGSRDWIGTFEAFLVIDHLFDVPCKILHANSAPCGENLKSVFPQIVDHFRNGPACPAMMGGDADASSKCVLGVSQSSDSAKLLIADPHLWTGSKSSTAPASLEKLLTEGWIAWKDVETDFNDSSMYNICLPQLK